MKYFNKILFSILCIALFSVYAGNTTDTQKQDTVKTTVNTDNKKKNVKTPTASKGVIPTKTNWSKIKDLFM
jgi:hypothetical protein